MWLKDKVRLTEVDGPPGVFDRLSIDDVADARDALHEWDEAKGRVAARQRGDRIVGVDEPDEDE